MRVSSFVLAEKNPALTKRVTVASECAVSSYSLAEHR